MAVTSLLLALSSMLPLAQAGKKAVADSESKEALQALQEYIGGWKGSGTSEKNKSEIWKETARWGWNFKGKAPTLVVEMPQSKFYKGGELRYLPEKEHYQLTLTDKNDNKAVFEGELKRDVLTLKRDNPDSGDTEQIRINSAGGGDRLVYAFWVRPAGRTMFARQYQVGYTKEGVTFGVEPGGKKPECVVTGGLGTMQVSYNGQTYWVCCSGCRDAFNENPAKMIAEYKARKRAGN